MRRRSRIDPAGKARNAEQDIVIAALQSVIDGYETERREAELGLLGGETGKLLAKLTQLRNEKAALEAQLRDTARDLKQRDEQVRSGTAMLAAARRECAANCDHAKAIAGKDVQLIEMQKVMTRLQAANQAYTEADLRPAARMAAVPRQRGRRG